MNTKIILSLSVIVAVAAIAVGGTMAYFSDTETSTHNTFSAGTIDIAIDSSNPWTKSYDIGDLKPGETGNITFDVQNVGANPVNVSKNLSNWNESTGSAGYVCPASGSYNGGNVSSEPECVKAQATGSDVNNVESQIIYGLSVKVYANSTDTNPTWWQTIYTDANGKSLSQVYPDANTYVALGMIPVGGHMVVTQSYHFNPLAENEYQGDALSFDITLKAEQMPQGTEGQATVTLENKTAAPEYAVIADGYQGVLTYKTTNPTFDFSFTGKVTQVNTPYTLLYAVDPWPQTGSKVLGTEISDGIGNVNFSGTVTPGSITNGKVWLVLATDWNGTQMSAWNQADYLLETGLINYVQN
jgi:predicted ribosomally synthesized peptide with SipW-like signal peptide